MIKAYPIPIGTAVIFDDIVFEYSFYSPYYDKYKGEVFMVESYMMEDDSHGHVFVKCITDPTIKIDGCVHIVTLKVA